MNLLSWLGRLRSTTVVWGLAAVFCAWIAADAALFGASDGLQRATYDAMVRGRLWARAADPRVVVLDIDEASLARMSKDHGRWPWPRDTLASVTTYLESQGVAAIVWDILFIDRDVEHPDADAAFDTAARASPHSHFSVVRLPEGTDEAAEITPAQVKSLWVDPAPAGAKVAAIPPVLASVAAGRTGFSNTSTDRDGALRRYRYAETLRDGGIIKSVALSVAEDVEPESARKMLARLRSPMYAPSSLVSWRKSMDAYPRIPFWKAFDEAKHAPVLDVWRGKVVVIGSTAAALHDYHPSPVAPHHPGVLILAQAVDDALHADQPAELPESVLAAFAICMCLAIAAWAHFRSVASLEPLLVLLPGSLLAASYASLHGAPVFLELQWSAALALTFLAILRFWANLRREHWCRAPEAGDGLAVWTLQRDGPWVDAALDRLIDSVERHAPACRIVAPDTVQRWPGNLRWPELARCAAVVGPADAIDKAAAAMAPKLRRLAAHPRAPVKLPPGTSREGIATACMASWAEAVRNP